MIIPTILTSDSKELQYKLNQVRGKIGLVQVDIVDGIFAPNKTVGLSDLHGKPDGVNVELHLMVDRPEDWVEEAAKYYPTSIVAQVEMMEDPEKFFVLTAEAGIIAGVAIDLPTQIEDVSPVVLTMAEKVLLMAVKAGEGGQEFDNKVLQKISLAGIIPASGKIVSVDGGLNKETIKMCVEAGAREFCVGSAFWSADDLLKRYGELGYIAGTGNL